MRGVKVTGTAGERPGTVYATSRPSICCPEFAGGLNSNVQRLQKGGRDEDVSASLVSSTEYFNCP
jgi:hypothetical protein